MDAGLFAVVVFLLVMVAVFARRGKTDPTLPSTRQKGGSGPLPGTKQ